MIIEYYTHSPERSKVRTIQVGQTVVGCRILTLVINSQDELNKLLSEKGVEWAKKHLRFPIKIEPPAFDKDWDPPWETLYPRVTEGKPEDWSDVVDAIPSYFDCGYNCDCATAMDCLRK